MDRIEKFFRKLSPNLRSRLIKEISEITENRLEGKDIKPIKRKKGWYRCRVGNIRIIFTSTSSGTNVVTDAEFRGKVYRRF